MFENVILFQLHEWLTREIEYIETELVNEKEKYPGVEKENENYFQEVDNFIQKSVDTLKQEYQQGKITGEDLIRNCKTLCLHLKQLLPEGYSRMSNKSSGHTNLKSLYKAFSHFVDNMRVGNDLDKLAAKLNLHITVSSMFN